MGFFSSFLSLFKADQPDAPPEEAVLEEDSPPHASWVIPHTEDLIYPAPLPSFSEIAEAGHADPRCILYTLLRLDTQRARPFPEEKLYSEDFTPESSAYDILLSKGLIQEPPPREILVTLCTQKELKDFLQSRGLRVGGNKRELADRLLDSGFTIKPGQYQRRLFELTERGLNTLKEYRSDEHRATLLAINALRDADFGSAISAYRNFDGKWGFVRPSGRNHTIFAGYNIPFRRFEFIANYEMPELSNSDEFKESLRVCLLACQMRGFTDSWDYMHYFHAVCQEPIQCPNIVDYFKDGDCYYGESAREYILAAMRRKIAEDERYILAYYISHVRYLSRQY